MQNRTHQIRRPNIQNHAILASKIEAMAWSMDPKTDEEIRVYNSLLTIASEHRNQAMVQNTYADMRHYG